MAVGTESQKVMGSRQTGGGALHGRKVQPVWQGDAPTAFKNVRRVAVPDAVDVGLFRGAQASVEAFGGVFQRNRADVRRQKLPKLTQQGR